MLLAVVGAWSGVIARYRGLAALTLAAVLVGTTGGLSTLLAVVWPQIRAWNRLSIFIAFFALLAVGLLLESLRPRLPALGFGALLAGLLVLGALDQTSPFFIPPHAGLAADYRADQSWYRSVEGQLPEGASVVQLPHEPFPEPPLGPRPIYEPAKAYLHTSDLRWSWGAMRGRPDDWSAPVCDAARRRSSSRQRARRASRRSSSTSSRTRTAASRPRPTCAECSAPSPSAAPRAAISSGASEAK